VSSALSLSSLALLFPGTSTGSSGSLLSLLYKPAVATGATAGDALTALQQAEKDNTQEVALTAKQPAVARDIQAFRTAVANATDTKSLLSNPAFMKVFLTANGLGDQVPYTALAQKALMSDPSDSSSLANQLSDTRWQSVVKTYDFAANGLSGLQKSGVLDTLANGYAEVTWRQSLDATTPGLSNALTFRAEASSITSVDQILGDSVMRTVVTTALGIPAEIAFQPLEAQEKAISSRLDISQFQNSKFVDTFTQRYLVAANTDTSTSSATSLDALASQASGLVV
jgi:hypothetical protein